MTSTELVEFVNREYNQYTDRIYGLETGQRTEYVAMVDYLSGVGLKDGFIEVGSAWGASFHLWGLLIPNGPKVSVDIPGPDSPNGYPPALTMEALLERDRRWATHFSDVNPVYGDSLLQETEDKVAKVLDGRKVGFLYIDGYHAYDWVKNDFERYSKYVIPGGYVGFHDLNYPELRQFWNELKPATTHVLDAGFAGILRLPS